MKRALADKDFTKLGEIVEAEALEFHSILLTSRPPLILWYPGTVQVMLEVQQLRREGIECYFTINTGFNIHILTLPEFETQVNERLAALPLVKKTLTAKVGTGPKEITDHLFLGSMGENINQKANSPDELLDQVNDQDEVIGIVARPIANSDPKYTHREISVLLFDDQMRVVIQKRSPYKTVHPNMWSLLAGTSLLVVILKKQPTVSSKKSLG